MNELEIHVWHNNQKWIRKFPDTMEGALERYKHRDWLSSLGLTPIFPEDQQNASGI